jgi:glucose-1-phosphate thymidylyltransferase
MWGLIPAAGQGSRIQPLAFSKELLPVGGRDDAGTLRPRAVSEYLVERLRLGGADRIAFVVGPGKTDILEYYGGGRAGMPVAFVVQPEPVGLCDALFRAVPLVHPSESVLVGLPDTIWFPEDALAALPDGELSFLLFPVGRPELFDAVITDEAGRVLRIQVKEAEAQTEWVWGAFKLPGTLFHALHRFWQQRGCADVYVGTLVNAWLARGGTASGVRAGRHYVDVGTLDGYRAAMNLLGGGREAADAA